MARSATGKGGEALQKAIVALEQRVDSLGSAVFGTNEFARAANTANALTNRMKKGVSDHMAGRLSFYNMPSREDVAALGERVMVMDERLVRIEALLEKLTTPAVTAPSGPPRTKRPPARAEAAPVAEAPPKPKSKPKRRTAAQRATAAAAAAKSASTTKKSTATKRKTTKSASARKPKT